MKTRRKLLYTALIAGEFLLAPSTAKESAREYENITPTYATETRTEIQQPIFVLAESQPENPSILRWGNQRIDSSKLVNAMIQHESGGDPMALSHRLARGEMQIRAIVLKEYRNLNPEPYIFLGDLHNPETNKRVGVWYLNKIATEYLPSLHLPVTVDNIVTAYHRGIHYLEVNGDATRDPNLPNITKRYINHVKKALAKN